jgi:hypothetical protein
VAITRRLRPDLWERYCREHPGAESE